MSSIASFQRNQLRVVHPAQAIVALVPKAGNSSLRHAMQQGIAPGRPLKEFDDSIRIGKQISPHAPIPQDYIKIIMVRNPWMRLRSCYTNKIMGPVSYKGKTSIGAGFANMGCSRNMSFVDFARLVHQTPDPLLEKHLMPVHYLLDNPQWGGAPNLLLRLEEREDWLRFRYVFTNKGFNMPGDMPQVNTSDRFQRPPFTPEIIRLIGERYERDIQLLGYEAPTC